jgi:DNA-binding beta-propeller fold protein YncE
MSSPALPSSRSIEVGSGAHRYAAQDDWAQLPDGWSLVEVAGVATDRAGRVFVFNRGAHPLIVFDRDGRFLTAWGEGLFTRPHGITIGPDETVFCVDDAGHIVRTFTSDGQPLGVLGAGGQASNTGATTVDYRTIRRSAGPFNFPTNLAVGPGGELFVADGYGNARVHRFAGDGRWLASWGEPGDGLGEFHVPHGIAVDPAGIVYVADRENSRIQRFTTGGEFIDQWSEIARPCQVTIHGDRVYVAELGFRAGMFPGNQPPPGKPTGGRLSIFDAEGRLLARLGGGDHPCSPGDFFAPHDVCVDPFGDLYVGEVTMSAGASRGLVSPTCHTLQKFTVLKNLSSA